MTPASGFTPLGTLSKSRRTVLYRAIRDVDRRRVVLKVLDARGSRPKDLERLKHEYRVAKLLRTPAVVAPLALDTYQGMPALVLEDIGANSLEASLGAPMPASTFLPIAIRIAQALVEIHQRGASTRT